MMDFTVAEKGLRAQRREVSRLLAQAGDAAQTVELDQNRLGRLSRMDAMQGQAMAQANTLRQLQRLKEIDGALLRIKQGIYGRCRGCDEDSPGARLELDLTTAYCVECAGARE